MHLIKDLLGEEKYYHLKRCLRFSPIKKWLIKVRNDFSKINDVPFKKKIWAYRKGFYSRRIVQYGMNEDNVSNFISDLDYLKLYPINNKFGKWIDDKLTLKYVLAPFDEFLPKYYFHLTNRGDRFFKLIDCPEIYERSVKGLLSLLRTEKKLVFKKVSGSHGKGFYKLSFDKNIYLCNDNVMSEPEISEFIDSLDNYIVTEYIKLHDEIIKIYPHSVSTVRIMTINEDGNNPVIGTAYFRVETNCTGIANDNLEQGPLVCMINLQTGYYCDPIKIVDGYHFMPCEIHPDTGVNVCGNIPNWAEIKKNILEICGYIPQVEYMGFDVAVTNEGLKILEINSYQDLYRFDLFDEEVKKYFSRLLKKKRIKSTNGF